jgi:hypothetical protein
VIEINVALIAAEKNNLTRVQRPMIRSQQMTATCRGWIENLGWNKTML